MLFLCALCALCVKAVRGPRPHNRAKDGDLHHYQSIFIPTWP